MSLSYLVKMVRESIFVPSRGEVVSRTRNAGGADSIDEGATKRNKMVGLLGYVTEAQNGYGKARSLMHLKTTLRLGKGTSKAVCKQVCRTHGMPSLLLATCCGLDEMGDE